MPSSQSRRPALKELRTPSCEDKFKPSIKKYDRCPIIISKSNLWSDHPLKKIQSPIFKLRVALIFYD
jgi:hypothetical protein